MSENDLFGAADAPESMTRPLAVRMRPRTLDEVIGQTQVLGQGSPLRRLANPASKGSLTAPSSVILFGPPGVGKTTLATIVAGQSGRVFEELSAVTSGVKDVRDVLTRAHERLVSRGRETVLFIDEVHRFSKSQQDALLPAVENRDVTFIGATTENPSFSIIKPLLSRSVVVKLESLEPDQLTELVQRALTDDRGSGTRSKPRTKPSPISCAWPVATHARVSRFWRPRLARSPATKPAKRAHADPSSPPKSWLR